MKKSIQFRILVMLTSTILFVTFSFYAYQLYFTDNILVDKPKTILYIPTGATYEQVVDSMKINGMLHDELSFRFVSKTMGYIDNVKPGRYSIETNSNNRELIKKLIRGEQSPVNLTFNTMWVISLDQLYETLDKYLEPSATDFKTYIESDSVMKALGVTKETLPCVFIPNTYQFFWNTSPRAFVNRLKKENENFWTQARQDKAKMLALTPQQVITLASIVEGEALKNDEKPRIAGLYINRIKQGMPLQADPTVVFALGDHTRRRLYEKDLKMDSPYNTYKYPGLPPGPIKLPSITSIDAVLNYEKHDYVFMCASHKLNGYHNFAVDYNTHLKNRDLYVAELNRRNIK